MTDASGGEVGETPDPPAAGERGRRVGPARVRFDRWELAGAFGDLGTDFPLVVGMILASGLDAASVLVVFGLMQVFSGTVYGLPMPAQPLKAVAVLVIAGGITPEMLYGGGLAIGAAMLLLTVTGLIDRLDRLLPKAAIRGIQVGLGLTLAHLALADYVPAAGGSGLVLAGAAAALIVALHRTRVPPALVVVALGVGWAFVVHPPLRDLGAAAGFALPEPRLPGPDAVLEGFVVLGLAQIPLSLGNSIFATRQLVTDLFPDREASAGRLALTYSAMNLVGPLLSGIPTCHGSGGLAGHHAFGGRTGGSAVLYGSMYLGLGLFLSRGFDAVAHLFPLPVLGVILLVEALALVRVAGDVLDDRRALAVTAVTGLAAVALPYGFLVGLVAGTALWYGLRWWGRPEADA